MTTEADWEECLLNSRAYSISFDKSKMQSLISTAKARIAFLDRIATDENNIRFIFESYYSSLLEYAHALLSYKKYKVRNHICLGYYLRDILKREDLFRIFDESRYKRNSIVYYGEEIPFEKTKSDIKRIKFFIKEINKIISKGDKN